MKEIFEYIEQHHDAYLEELFTFLRCKSISTRDEGVKECAELLAGIMEKSKIKASIYPCLLYTSSLVKPASISVISTESPQQAYPIRSIYSKSCM